MAWVSIMQDGGKEGLFRGSRRGSWNSMSPTLPSLCQQGVQQAGFAPFCSESAKLAQAQIAPKVGREEEV